MHVVSLHPVRAPPTLVPRHQYRGTFIDAHTPIKVFDTSQTYREDTKEREGWSPE